jgi:hypothetical protein
MKAAYHLPPKPPNDGVMNPKMTMTRMMPTTMMTTRRGKKVAKSAYSTMTTMMTTMMTTWSNERVAKSTSLMTMIIVAQR